MQYTLAHSAKKNVDGYLYLERTRELLLRYTDVRKADIFEVDIGGRTLEEGEFSRIQQSDAVILAGGPVYSDGEFYGRYPTLDRVLDEGIPIYPVGAGWWGTEEGRGLGFRGADEEEFEFTDKSMELLERIHERIDYSGVRDLPTKRILEKNGISNVELVGCPSWYDLNSMGKSFIKPTDISSFLISINSVGARYYRRQITYLLHRLDELYPNADLYMSFHAGLSSDQYTSFSRSLRLRLLKSKAKYRGCTVINAAYEPETFEQYRNIDCHIGYSVGAHAYFLSMRHPSYLLQTDGQGVGMSETLSTPGDVEDLSTRHFPIPIEEALSNVKRDIETRFHRFDPVEDTIEDTYPHMQTFFASIS